MGQRLKAREVAILGADQKERGLWGRDPKGARPSGDENGLTPKGTCVSYMRD